MTLGLIICAGKQTRFHSSLPKALVEYEGKPLLDLNIENMQEYCDKIYVVCSYENESYFNNYNKIIINSGNGCGYAVLRALEQLNLSENDSCFIQWGDAYLDKSVYYYTKKDWDKVCVRIPCVKEEKPYVQLIQYEHGIRVKFSKFGETITPGYHDLSLFYGNALNIKNKLKEFENKILDKDGKYHHKHNNELEFLDIFNETDVDGQIIEFSNNYKCFSFNTIEQLNNIKGVKNV